MTGPEGPVLFCRVAACDDLGERGRRKQRPYNLNHGSSASDGSTLMQPNRSSGWGLPITFPAVSLGQDSYDTDYFLALLG
jgi:hypothetical protein